MSLFHLGHAMRKDRSSGRPLRTVWKDLTNATAIWRQGALVLIGAGSGTGKSALALTLAIQSGAKTIYFSADSGPGTQLARAAAMVLGKPLADTQQAIEKGYYFENELAEIRRIRWDLNAGPSLDDIEQSMKAYGYLHGEYPELVIVDNLLNVVSDDSGDGGFKTDENVLLFLAELARTTGACVTVLAHLVGEYDDGDKPAPMSSLRGKVSKIPEMILTLHRIEDPMDGERLGVCIVKNRSGKANAAGNMVVELDLDLSMMKIEDKPKNDILMPV